MRRLLNLSVYLIIFIFIASFVQAVTFNLYQTRNDNQLYGPFSRGISVIDVDNDDDLDLVLGGYDGGTSGSIIYSNDGTGTYSIKQTLDNPSPDSTAGVPVGDIDNDGYIDLFASNTYGANPQYVYHNNAGTFSKAQSIDEVVYSGGGQFGDIDNDGDLDLVMSGGKNSAPEVLNGRIYLNNGSGYFVFNTNISQNISEIDATIDVQLADFDNDGYLDIVTLPGNNENIPKTPVGIFKNDGTGNFSLYSKLPHVVIPNGALEINDFDGDNYQDIAIVYEEGKATTIYKNNGDATFTEFSNLSDRDLRGRSVSSADIDNDGDNDLMISYDNQVAGGKDGILYLNDGSGNFVKDSETTESDRSTQLRCFDIDDDGKLDFVVGIYPSSKMLVYKNTIASTNAQPSAPTAFSSSYSNGKLTLSWDTGSDIETPANLLMYNIKIGTLSGAQNIVSGVYGTPMKGNIQQRKNITLNLPNQDYYWSVQTIDSGLRTSGWSTEQVYIYTNAPPTHTNPILSSTFGTNLTSENLTCYSQNLYDVDGDPVTAIFNWKVDGQSITELNIPFDTQSSTISKDYSGNSNDGTITGAAWTSQGKSGGAMSFDGAGDYVEVGDTASFKWMHGADNPSDFNFTISLWMQLDNPEPGDTYTLVSTEGGSSSYIGISTWFEDYPTQGSRKLRLAIFNGVPGQWVTNYYSPDNVYPFDTGWHMVAFTYNHALADNNIIIYVDGIEVSRGNKDIQTPSTADSTYNLHIGSLGNILDEFAGKIDDVKIYKKVLSAEQIYQDYIDSDSDARTIVSQETDPGQEWKCSVIPNDGIEDGITLDSNNLVITGCAPNWVAENNTCQPDDQQLMSYTDVNNCGMTEGLPADNGTYAACDYTTCRVESETHIITEASEKYPIAIYGDKIVWQDYRNGNPDIYLYNLSTSTERRITTNTGSQGDLAIYGDKIVWRDDRNGFYDIYMYDLNTSTETKITTNSSIIRYNPAIYGNKILWESNIQGNSDILMYDLSKSTETQITNDTDGESNPAIYKDKIVYEDYRNGNYDIYMHDLFTGIKTRITTDPKGQGNPAIYGNKIMWSDHRNQDVDIYMYNLLNSTETRITTHKSGLSDPAIYNYVPAIYGDKIVWDEYRNGSNNWDIYMYDLSTSKEIQITTNLSDQVYPAIYGNKIIYEDNRNGNWDIYVATLSAGCFETCIPDWVADNNPCLPNSTKLITYTDANSCGMTEGLPADNGTYAGCLYCHDSDNDGVCDADDPVNGTASDVNTTIPDFNLTIDGDYNLSQPFEGTLTVELKQAMQNIAEFNFNFSKGELDLNNITVSKQLANATKGYVTIKGVPLQQGATKTLYIDDLNLSIHYLCIKDVDINDISQISNNCNQPNEYILNCNGIKKQGYTCTKNGSQYVITGLKHSGVTQFQPQYRFVQIKADGDSIDSFNPVNLGDYWPNPAYMGAHEGPGTECAGAGCWSRYAKKGVLQFNITNGTARLAEMTLDGVVFASTNSDKKTFSGTALMWGDASIISVDPSFPITGSFNVVLEYWRPDYSAFVLLNSTGSHVPIAQFTVNMSRIMTNEIILRGDMGTVVDDVSISSETFSLGDWGSLTYENDYKTIKYNLSNLPEISNHSVQVGYISQTGNPDHWGYYGWGKTWYNKTDGKYHKVIYAYVVDEDPSPGESRILTSKVMKDMIKGSDKSVNVKLR